MQLRFVLGGLAVATYAVAAFYTATHALQSPQAVLVALGPLSLAILLTVRKTLGLAALVVATVALAGLFYRFVDDLQAHVAITYYLQHLGMQCCGALIFGLSLIPPRIPLCTRFASYAHDYLTPEHVIYARWATVAWMLFFVLMAGISALLFFSSLPFSVWAAFEAFSTLPMVALMFIIEYIVRCRVLKHKRGSGIAGAWQAFEAYKAYQADQAKQTEQTKQADRIAKQNK